MELPKLNFRDFVLFTVFVVVLLSVGFFFLLEKPRLDSIARIKQEQEEALKLKQTAEQTLTRLKAARKESAEIEARLIRLSKKMPEDPELASLIVEVQELAIQSGVGLISIKPNPPVQAGEYSELKLEMQIQGYFFDLVDFLYRVEKFPRETRVMSINAAAGPEGLPHLSVSLIANTYVLVTGQASVPPAATQAPAPAPTAGEGM